MKRGSLGDTLINSFVIIVVMKIARKLEVFIIISFPFTLSVTNVTFSLPPPPPYAPGFHILTQIK